MDNYQVRQGTALDFTVSLMDTRGDPITSYTGVEALTATVWPGGSLAASFSPAVAWLLPSAGTISAGISAAQTSPLAEGRYRGTLDLADPINGQIEAYAWSFDVLLAPGTGTVAPSYCSYPDLLEFGRSWLRGLQSDDDDAGFSAQCGRARSWLDDLIVAAWQGLRTRGIDPGGFGPPLGGIYLSNYPSIFLRQQLDAGGLSLRGIVVEICAKKALGFICEGQVGPSDQQAYFAKLARYYHREANYLACTLRAEINTNPATGYPQFVVTLGTRDMRG